MKFYDDVKVRLEQAKFVVGYATSIFSDLPLVPDFENLVDPFLMGLGEQGQEHSSLLLGKLAKIIGDETELHTDNVGRLAEVTRLVEEAVDSPDEVATILSSKDKGEAEPAFGERYRTSVQAAVDEWVDAVVDWVIDDSDVYDAQERLLNHLLPISESAANVYEKNTEILTAPVDFFVESWDD